MTTYFEDFDDGPGGWHGWVSNAAGPSAPVIQDGAVVCRGPWWVDYNHAPPGAGYLHLLMGLRTRDSRFPKHSQEVLAVAGRSRFAQENHSTDFRHARVTLRLRGQLDLHGAQLVYHVQAQVNGIWVNYALTGQPFTVTADWSEQTVTLDPDPNQWTCLGSRHDRQDFYGSAAIDDVLRDMNGNMILVLFPLNIVPANPDQRDLHVLRAAEDYELDRTKLPNGWAAFDWVRIETARSPAKAASR